MITITSGANPAIKDLLRLKKARNRKKDDLIIVDGVREVSLAIKAGLPLVSLFYSEYLAARHDGQETIKEIAGDRTMAVTKEIFEKISYKENPDGYLATFRRPSRTLRDIKTGANTLLIVLENVEKPGNIGAIVRTAAAAGVDGIILNSSQTDIYNPNVIRASEGEIFSRILVEATQEETQRWLESHGIASFAALTDGAEEYTRVDLTGPAAIILGSEADGLSPAWQRAADKRIRIPMAGEIDSLNVSVAAAIICFEALRQRRLGSI